ncbi:PHP domain-containing protein [Variovorax sp. M-6]
MCEPPPFAELHCRSNFTFLVGASQPEELVERAAAKLYSALTLTDECSVSGVVSPQRPPTQARRTAHGQIRSAGTEGPPGRRNAGQRKAWLAPKRRAANVPARSLAGQGACGTYAIKRKPGCMPRLQTKRTDLHEKYDNPGSRTAGPRTRPRHPRPARA